MLDNAIRIQAHRIGYVDWKWWAATGRSPSTTVLNYIAYVKKGQNKTNKQ